MGTIHALTFDEDWNVVEDEVIETLDEGLTLGITYDPESTPDNVILWISHSSPHVYGGQINSSVITRLSGPNHSVREDIITGLPRANANHAINGIHFGTDGRLYIAVGSNTGTGAPHGTTGEFGDRPEQPLSAALLVADVKSPTFQGECATPLYEFGIPEACDVSVFSSGLRNMYDFTVHSNGYLYGPNNGLGVEGTVPPSAEAPCTGLADLETDNPGAQGDSLYLLEEGNYYGHPNPYRDECVFGDGTFQGVDPLPNYTPAIWDLGLNRSADGIIEYDGDVACGALDGDLLITNYSVGDSVTRVQALRGWALGGPCRQPGHRVRRPAADRPGTEWRVLRGRVWRLAGHDRHPAGTGVLGERGAAAGREARGGRRRDRRHRLRGGRQGRLRPVQRGARVRLRGRHLDRGRPAARRGG
ncbi:hypothetical protein GCM10025876_31630 [Demequina litorisediminis]|uniref:Glucose/Sorbosone dehydrogenase domain-containing protein n=1 Tax=Demequina litorisediminis TaxID=1849022 RepID=A0ABQ6IJV4_9MICO|nr:hypothetical protein [Demequina litorisediminis]GMA36959.1 hypothetical protein GCM10025876_31630 [Demequina litorisediminis]